MKTLFRAISLVMMILFVVVFTQSQSRRAGANGAAFLNVGVGARAIGLGSATAAISNDVNQVFWNPAGVALKDEMLQASFDYNKWIGDLNHNAFAVSYNLKDIGTLALGVVMFGATDIPADRDVYPNNPDLWQFQIDDKTSDTYNYSDLAISLTYSRYLMDNLSLGITAKLVTETIDEKTATAVAFDFGSVYDIGLLNWKIAARMSNLGSDLKFYDFPVPLPLVFSIGTSIMPLNEDMYKVFFTVDGIKWQDGPQYFFAGGEVTLMDILSLRAGYKFNYSGTQDEGTSIRPKLDNTLEGFSFGAGVKVPISEYDIRVDYSYTDMNLFDPAHRISIHFGLK
ncbi:MAG TPA: PorV/PorQ family protein [Ignavibacteria bacterium]